MPANTPLNAELPLPATGPYVVSEIDTKRSVVKLVRNPHFRVWSTAAQPDGYPDAIVERWGYTGPSAVRAVERGTADVTSTGFDKTWPPALMSALRTRYSSRLYTSPQATSLGLWMNTRVKPFDDVRVRQAVNYAVDRNRLVEIERRPGQRPGGLPDAAAEHGRVSAATARTPSTPTPPGPITVPTSPRLASSSRLRARRANRSPCGSTTSPSDMRTAATSPLCFKSLGYKARLKTIPHDGRTTWAPDRQTGVGGWGADYPVGERHPLVRLHVRFVQARQPAANGNYPGLCDRRVDREIARARSLQTTDPSAASKLWGKIDREITDQAPWVSIDTAVFPDFVSRRAGNYTYCFLSSAIGSTAACLGQLWVR